MIDLGLGSTWTNIDSGIWLKGSGVQIGSGIGSKSRNWNPISHSFSHNGMWLSKIGDLISRWTGTGSNTDSEKGLKSGKNTSVIIELGSEIELPSWGSRSYLCSSSILGKG